MTPTILGVSVVRAHAIVTALSIALGLSNSALAGGLPTLGQFVSGKGIISTENQSLTVTQATTAGIINWSSFSVGKNNTVTFNNGAGVTLNRVTGTSLSLIAGSLNATGSLYLMNSSGVIITGTGQVVTGGDFVATSGNISNTAFVDGERKVQDANAAVVNQGSITAVDAAGLIGGRVTEAGPIHAGNVNLQAGTGLTVSGSVSAQHADGTGGLIVATGQTVDVTNTASLSASGTTGGNVLVGGDVHGGAIAADKLVEERVPDAQTTIVTKGAAISANSTAGNGGSVVVWSDNNTDFSGTISAIGSAGYHGGFAEVSGHEFLGYHGSADLLSANGATGTLLLDPENVTIKDASTANGGLDDGLPTNTFTPSGDNSILSVSDLEAALASANVTVTTGSSGSQAGDITVAAPVTWSTSSALTLGAYHSIQVDAPISVTGAGGLVLATYEPGATIAVESSITAAGPVTLTSAGLINESGAGAIDAHTLTGSSVGGTVLNGDNQIVGLESFTNTGSGGFSLSDDQSLTVSGAVDAGAGFLRLTTTGTGSNIAIHSTLSTPETVVLTSAGSINESGAGAIDAHTLTGSSVGGTVLNGDNQIVGLESFTNTGSGGFSLSDDQSLTVSGAVDAGAGFLRLTTTGTGSNIAIHSTLSTPETVVLTSAGSINESGAGAIDAHTLTGSSVGGTVLNGDNQIVGLEFFTNTGSGGFSLSDDQSLTVSGAVDAGAGFLRLTTTGTGSNIAIHSTLSTPETVVLTSAGSINESGAGAIDAHTLTGSSVGGTVLNGDNQIVGLESFTNTGSGGFSLSDDQSLTVSGAVDAEDGLLSITTTGTNSNINIKNTLTTTGTAQVTSGGKLTESGSGAINAGFYTATQQLSSQSSGIPNENQDPVVSGNDVYVAYSHGGKIILDVSNDQGKIFSQVSLGTSNSKNPRLVAIGDQVYVDWQQGQDVYFSVGNNGGKTFSTPIDLGTAVGTQTTQIAANGDHIIVGAVNISQTAPEVWTSNNGGETWSTPILLSTAVGHVNEIVVDANGSNYFAAWNDKTPNGHIHAYEATSNDSGADYLPTIDLDPGYAITREPIFAISGDGQVDVVFRTDLYGRLLFVDSTNSGQTFSAPVELAENVRHVSVAADGTNLDVSFLERGETDWQVEFLHSENDGVKWDAAVDLADTGWSDAFHPNDDLLMPSEEAQNGKVNLSWIGPGGASAAISNDFGNAGSFSTPAHLGDGVSVMAGGLFTLWINPQKQPQITAINTGF